MGPRGIPWGPLWAPHRCHGDDGYWLSHKIDTLLNNVDKILANFDELGKVVMEIDQIWGTFDDLLQHV